MDTRVLNLQTERTHLERGQNGDQAVVHVRGISGSAPAVWVAVFAILLIVEALGVGLPRLVAPIVILITLGTLNTLFVRNHLVSTLLALFVGLGLALGVAPLLPYTILNFGFALVAVIMLNIAPKGSK